MSGYMGNRKPTEATVRFKLTRPGALFASDEVRCLISEIDRLRRQVDDYRSSRNELVARFIGTNRS